MMRNILTAEINKIMKTAKCFCKESILRINVCASTFRNLNGREATVSELSSMTGIPAFMMAVVRCSALHTSKTPAISGIN